MAHDLPPSSAFRISKTAAADDIDQLGHVSNLRYLAWVLDAALAHSVALGYDGEAYRRQGAVFVVRRHEVDYLRPACAGDRLEIATWVDRWKAASCVRRTAISRPADGQVLVRAATVWAYVEQEGGRPTRIPDAIKSAFGLDPQHSDGV